MEVMKPSFVAQSLSEIWTFLFNYIVYVIIIFIKASIFYFSFSLLLFSLLFYLIIYLSALCPSRRPIISKLISRALIGAIISCMVRGCVASILYEPSGRQFFWGQVRYAWFKKIEVQGGNGSEFWHLRGFVRLDKCILDIFETNIRKIFIWARDFI
jgi:hypothetical protein